MVEILQDDRIRDQLNPDVDNQQSNFQFQQQDFSDNLENCEDEEEMLEMMAMQEECHLEMMKFYIQSQNPKLFETIYHDVSYPDAIKSQDQEQNQVEQAQEEFVNNLVSSQPETLVKSPESSDKLNSLKQSIINNLNSNASEFVPSKLAELNLNDKENKKE